MRGQICRPIDTYDHAGDVYRCPGGKVLTTTGTLVNDGATMLYLASKHDCDRCALKSRCCPKQPSRRVPRSIYEGARDMARQIARSWEGRTSRRLRKKIDMLFAHLERMVRLRVDLIAAVGAVTARAARAATAAIPIVYSVVVQPAGDELARPSGDPLANMTGVTTFDDGQAATQIALLRAIKPDLTRIAYLSDVAVSGCLRNAGMRTSREAGLHAIDLGVVGPEPDLQTAFAKMQAHGTQALVALENPIIGVHAAQIAERALSQNLPALFALEQAGAGGLLSYGASLGQAAHRMAGQACRLLEGRSATELPIESLCCPSLVVDMRAARRLGLTVPPEVQQRAARIIRYSSFQSLPPASRAAKPFPAVATQS